MTKTPTCPFTASRRSVLFGLGAGGIGAAAALVSPAQAATAQAATPQATDAPMGHSDMLAAQVPYTGAHQAGIVTPRPEAGLMASFDVVAFSPKEVEHLLRRLTHRIAFLTQGGAITERDPRLPPVDSGLLGPVVQPDNLTITVGLGHSMFEGRDWLKGLKPARLQQMVEFPNDALEPAQCHGDLSIQFCANLPDTNIHALRDVVKHLSDFLVLRWTMEGSVPPVVPDANGDTPSARNFLGFRDGSANPDSTDAAAMDSLVWTHAPDEPDWTRGGSYQAVRLIRNFVERWDRSALAEQEAIFGRRKMSGAPLDGGPQASERDVPDYAADPEGKLTPLDSHIRMANPRTPDSRKNLILRRPFNYSRGVSANGQLDQGLLFICYQADLEAGFITVQNRLNGEPLEEYLKPFGGGYFFALPGIRDADDYLGSALITAARRA